jgi:hypothetical protein
VDSVRRGSALPGRLDIYYFLFLPLYDDQYLPSLCVWFVVGEHGALLSPSIHVHHFMGLHICALGT